MNKKNQQTIILVLLLVVLAAAVIYTLKGNAPSNTAPAAKPAAKTTTTADATTTPTPDASDPKKIDWVDPEKVGALVAQVEHGRNPFEDKLAPSPHPVQQPLPNKQNPTSPTTADSQKHTLTHTLHWVAPLDLARVFQQQHLNVKLESPTGDKRVVLSGLSPDFEQAKALMESLDVEPPVPQFQLTGVVVARSARFATLTVNGVNYALYRGDTIPELGWTLTEITSTGVTMRKGNHTVRLHLSGGNRS